MTEFKQVVTIAGSDSGGGAGIQADLKTFQEREVFGMSVLTAVTAQNTLGVQDVHPVPLEMVEAQWESLFADFDISAMKTGMLVNGEYMKLLARLYWKHREIPLVIDPVMIAKGGHALMEDDAVTVMKEEFIPLATLITPNIPEAEALTGIVIQSKEDMKAAAYALRKSGCQNVVIKGGHSWDTDYSEDFLLLKEGKEVWLKSERIQTQDTHGTGCTFAACITAELAKDSDVEAAVRVAKAYIQAAIKEGLAIGHGHGPTNHWAYRKETACKNQ